MPSPSILLVDDDDDTRTIGRMALARIGDIDVRCAADGAQAIEMALASPPDIVLLDVMMPGMSGPETLAAFREHHTLHAVPVIFVTATVSPDELSSYEAQGAAGVICKPYDVMRLASEVVRLSEAWHRARTRST